jgi:hypothetical protein
MSWLSQNYEKAAIGGAAVVALGLAVLGWSKVGSVDEDFPSSASGRGNRDPAVAEADRVPQARAALGLDRKWVRAETNGRPVDLFTGVPLFVDREAPQKGIDPMTGPPIHPPIPNTWWLGFGLDPGFADSPHRDPDEDGFSNLEEFEGGTDPTDPKSHPTLADKLAYRRDESIGWVLRPGVQEGDGFGFEYADTAGGQNRASVANPVRPGEIFFSSGAAKDRFKLLGSEDREEINPRTNAPETSTWVQIEDQKSNKKGLRYEIPARFPRDRESDFTNYDRTAVLTLEALGQEGQEFKVEENTTFSLPPGSGKDDHKLLSVTPEAIEVEYPASDGERRTITIPRR